jgi:hypothetical protein
MSGFFPGIMTLQSGMLTVRHSLIIYKIIYHGRVFFAKNVNLL